MKEKVLRLLGLAQRAGKIITGEEQVINAMQHHKVQIIFVAMDSSEHTKEQFEKKCFYYKIPCSFAFSSDELSQNLGKNRKIVALCDEGFYETYKKYIKGDKNEGKRDC